MVNKTTFVHAADALPAYLLSGKPLSEISALKHQQTRAVEIGGDRCFIDRCASLCSGLACSDEGGGGHGLGLYGVSEDQAVGGDFQALTEKLELPNVGLGITGFPKGNGGLVEACTISTHALTEFGLRKAFGAAGSGEAVTKGFFAWFFSGGDVRGGVFGPLAHLQIIETGKPFVFVAAVAGVNAAVNEDQFTGDAEADAFKGAMLNQFNAHAADTINVGCDAAYWVNRAPNLDVAVAEVADVEVFHGSDLGGYGLLVLAEPRGPQNFELPYALIWNVFTPLRNCAWGDAEKVGQIFGPLGEVNSLLGLHVSHFSTLKI